MTVNMPSLRLHIQACNAQSRCRPDDRRWLKRPDIDWQSFSTCSAKMSCPSYLTPNKAWNGLQNIHFPSIMMLGVQAEEGCLAFGCYKSQSRLMGPSDHIIYFWLFGCHDHVLTAGMDTHIGIFLEFGHVIVYVDIEKEGERDRALGQTFLESSRGAYGTVHSHSGCTVYETTG